MVSLVWGMLYGVGMIFVDLGCEGSFERIVVLLERIYEGICVWYYKMDLYIDLAIK